MPLSDKPGDLFISCSSTSSSGCRSMISRFGDRSSLPAPPKMECGTFLNWIMICVRRSGRRLPVRRKNGTPAHRQLSMSARSATKVSVVLGWPRSVS